MKKQRWHKLFFFVVIVVMIINSIAPSLNVFAISSDDTQITQSSQGSNDGSNNMSSSDFQADGLNQTQTSASSKNDGEEIAKENNQKMESNKITKRRGPNDIGGLVTQGPIGIEVKMHGKWFPLNPGDTIQTGNTLRFTVSWEILTGMTGYTQSGDWFAIDLPSAYFDFAGTGDISVLNNENEEIGKMKIVEKNESNPAQIVFTLSDIGAGKSYLRNGTFEVEGSANTTKTEDEKISVGAIELPPFIIEKPDGNAEFPGLGTIAKSGSQLSGKDEIQWRIDVNYDEYKNVFNGNALSSTKKNMQITDELPAGVKFKSIGIGSLIFAATTGGNMSAINIGWTNYSAVTEVTQTPTDTWTTFQAAVQGKSGSELPAFGVFHELDGTDKVAVNLGDLPGLESPMFNDPPVVGDSLGKTKAIIDSVKTSGGITEEIATKTKAAYDYIYSETKNKGILGITLVIEAEVTGDSGTYYNDAHAKWHEDEKNSGSIPVEYQKVGGKVESGDPGTIKLLKEDPYGNKLKDIGFKLQKKNSSGIFVDFIPVDGVQVRKTDENGLIEFSQLDPGTYRLVEVSHGPEFSGDVSYIVTDSLGNTTPTDEFVITGGDKKGFTAKAVNEYKKIKVEGEKTWIDGNDKFSRRPDSITVILKANGQEKERKIISAMDDWKYSFTELDPYDRSGEEIKYTIEEEAVPEYEATTDDYDLINTLKTGAVELTKVDENNDVLKDAEFIFYRYREDTQKEYYQLMDNRINWVSNESAATILKTDITGKILINGLPEGIYYFKEVKAPSGYALDQEEHEVILDATTINDVVKKALTLKNIPSEIIVEKIDANSKNLLPNAEFQLYNEANEELDSTYQADGTTKNYVTDGDGLIHLKKIPNGRYYLLETKAPNGYKLSEEKIWFEVKDGRLVDQEKVTIENKRDGSLPKTGGIGLGIVRAIGLSTLIIGCVGLGYTSRRDRRKRL